MYSISSASCPVIPSPIHTCAPSDLLFAHSPLLFLLLSLPLLQEHLIPRRFVSNSVYQTNLCGGSRGGATAPPPPHPEKWNDYVFFVIQFCIRMLKIRLRLHERALINPGLLPKGISISALVMSRCLCAHNRRVYIQRKNRGGKCF